jgi:AcrR family transcriptional regulator
MARLTRDERRDLTREQLLDAAERVFARLGFHGASVDAVAAEAGFTKGAVYSNFPGKDALFLALVDRRRASLEAQLAEAGTDAVDVLSAEDGSRQATDDPWGILTIEFFLYAAREPSARRAFADLYAATRRALAASLARVPVNEQTLDLSPMDLATVALALSTGFGVQAALDPDAVSPDLYQRVLAGLAGGQRPRP